MKGKKSLPGGNVLAANIEGIMEGGHPVLQSVPATHAEHGADQHNQRDLIVVDADGLGRLFQRIRRVGIHVAVPGVIRAFRGMHQVRGSVELRHHSVDSRIHFGRGAHCFTFACGSRVRISKTEIEGMTRMKKKNSIVNRPMVPIKIIRSHLVYQYMPQELGRKSRCRLATTITKPSTHIPVLTTTDTRNNCHSLEHTFFTHTT